MLVQRLMREGGPSVLCPGKATFPSLFRSKLREQPLCYSVLFILGQLGSGVKSFLEQISHRLASCMILLPYSGSQCSWTASAASTLGKDEKGAVTPAKTAQGRQSVRGPIPLHNAVDCSATPFRSQL